MANNATVLRRDTLPDDWLLQLLLQHRHPSVEEEEEATEEETEEEEMMAEESGKVGRITRCLTSCYYHKYIDVFLLWNCLLGPVRYRSLFFFLLIQRNVHWKWLSCPSVHIPISSLIQSRLLYNQDSLRFFNGILWMNISLKACGQESQRIPENPEQFLE